jgi:hypothetical protein
VAVAREIWRVARLRGWGQKGKPLPGKAPHGH